MNDSPPPPNTNLPVPHQQVTTVGRPAGGRVPPPQSWQTGEPDAVPWGQYLDGLRRRWWVVLLVGVVGSYIGRTIAMRVPAEYSTFLKIFVSGVGRGSGGAVSAPSPLTTTTLQEIVKQPDVVAPVIRRLALNVHFDLRDAALGRGFRYDTAGGGEGYQYRLVVDSTGRGYTLTKGFRSPNPVDETGMLGDSIGRSFGLQWQPPAQAFKPKQVVDFGIGPIALEALGLAGKLRTGFDQDGGQILTLMLESNNRETIAPTLNEWAAEFVRYTTETKKKSLTENRRVVEQQLGQAKGALDVAERNLQRFREASLFTPQEAPGTLALANQVAQLAQIVNDRARIDAVLRTLAASPQSEPRIDEGRLSGSPTLMAFSPRLSAALTSLAAADANLRTQLATFADSSNQVKTALAQRNAIARNVIPEILRDIDQTFEESEESLVKETADKRAEISLIPQRTFDGLRLQRIYDAAAKQWTDLNQTALATRLVEDQTNADLTIMGPAIPPPMPSSSRGPRLFILAVGASFGAGLALALLLDRMDRRFRYPQQATMELGLTIAGTIPYFKPNRKGELNLAASAQVVESFRTLRLATQFHFQPGEPVVVCISSPGPGEGKSLVASNLAVAFANAGSKTLLIDGDVRRGVVHTTFEADRRPGLVDYLGGTASAAQIVRPTSTDKLFIVPSGSRSRRAPELLVSDRMQGLIQEMRTQYDVVIVDSAPFVAGMDAFALGAAAGTMLVVLRPGLTDRKLAENKLEIIDRLPITIIGAVLNAISGGRAYRYYSDYTTYDGPEDNLDEADFDQAAPPPTSPTRLIGRR